MTVCDPEFWPPWLVPAEIFAVEAGSDFDAFGVVSVSVSLAAAVVIGDDDVEAASVV